MGGAEIQIKYLVSFFKKKDLNVHYIFEDKDKPYTNELNINLHPLKRIKIPKTIGNRWFLYRNTILKLLHTIEPNVIYTRFYSSWTGMASNYSVKNKIPHLWAIASNNDLVKKTKFNFLLKPFDFFEYLIIINAFKHTKNIIVQNNEQKLLLKKNFGIDGLLLRQAVPKPKNEKINKEYNKLNIVWIANLKKIKRPEYFIQIADEYSDNPNFKFIMIGRQNENYKKLIEESNLNNSNFQFRGEVSNSEVNEILLESHILINTSEYEGFSNVFLQAWSRKNIVFSMNSNPDEILTKENIGCLIPTIEEIKNKLNYFWQNREELEGMSERAYKYVAANHNLDYNLHKIAELMKI
ncbi:glycosyltransferase [uncultured Winogradskyella sp.]|uniref:glycosyltransferase family 4 protein n=1 Tax=uncultured Winogradskyella sp. TaxID=395353 RepID=UPI0030DBB3DB